MHENIHREYLSTIYYEEQQGHNWPTEISGSTSLILTSQEIKEMESILEYCMTYIKERSLLNLVAKNLT